MITLTWPQVSLSLSLSVCLLINFCRRLLDAFSPLLHLLPIIMPFTRRSLSFVRRTRFIPGGMTGFAATLACSIIGRFTISCQISPGTLFRCCSVVSLEITSPALAPGGMVSVTVSSSKITDMGVLFLVCRWWTNWVFLSSIDLVDLAGIDAYERWA